MLLLLSMNSNKMEGSLIGQSEESFVLRDWEDDDRMNFMFSAFPKDKNTNPKHWQSKLAYWIDEIKRCCKFYSDVCVTCEALRERFRRRDKVPQGLSIVLLHMENEGMLTNQEHLLKALEKSWLNWSYCILKGSAKWMWSALIKNDSNDILKQYVVLESIEDLGTEILNKHYQTAKFDKTDHVVPWNVVKNLYVSKKPISDEELLLVVAFLKMKKLADLEKNNLGEMIVKFAKNMSSTVIPVNENDWHVVRLKKALAKLKIESTEIKTDISKLQKSAQLCLQENDRSQAKRLLYQKRKLEKSYNMKQDTLLTLTDQLQTIQNSDSNKMILDAISSSAAMLNTSLQGEGLRPEEVDKVFEKSVEAFDLAKEIDNSIYEGLKQTEDDFDTQELEEELAELLLDKEKENESSARDVLFLPKVPTHSPGPATKETVVKKKVRTLAL